MHEQPARTATFRHIPAVNRFVRTCHHVSLGHDACVQNRQWACRRVFRDTGRLLVAFLLGSVATVIGTLVAFKALPLTDMGADGWKVTIACLPLSKYVTVRQQPAVQNVNKIEHSQSADHGVAVCTL